MNEFNKVLVVVSRVIFFCLCGLINFCLNIASFISRDEPNTEKPLIVHVDNTEHFPKCDIVGFVDPFYVIAYLIGNTLPARFRSLFSKDWVGESMTDFFLIANFFFCLVFVFENSIESVFRKL